MLFIVIFSKPDTLLDTGNTVIRKHTHTHTQMKQTVSNLDELNSSSGKGGHSTQIPSKVNI